MSVPVRAAPALAPTVNCVWPGPLPLVPDVIEIHGAWLLALHAQPAPVVTATGFPAPPPAPIDWFVGAIENAQVPPSWETVKVWLEILNVPVRAAPALALTTKLTTPSAVPAPPAVIPTHGTVLVADHGQPLRVRSVTVPEPPAAGTNTPGLLRLKVHSGGSG